jgi:hypothetical protein
MPCLGIIKVSDCDRSMLHPVSVTGEVDYSILVQEKIVFTSDNCSPGKAAVEWLYRSVNGGAPYCRRSSIPGGGVSVEDLVDGEVASRALFDRLGRLVTERKNPDGALTVFSPDTGNRVVDIYDGRRGFGNDFELSPLSVVPTKPPPFVRVLYGQSRDPLPLPLPAALSCAPDCKAESSQVDALGAGIGSLMMLEYLIKYGFIYVSDDPNEPDHWQQPAETLNRYSREGFLQGDCDDLAFLCSRLAKQFGVDLPVAFILSADAAHALNLLVKETRDGGYVAATICTFGIDDYGAIRSDEVRAKTAPTIEAALERVLTKYPPPQGHKRVPIPRYLGIPCTILLFLSEAGEQKRVTVPLVALVDPVLRDEIVSVGGIKAALNRLRDDEHPWITANRQLLKTSSEDRMQVNYLLALIKNQFDVDTISSVAQELDLSQASEPERQDLFQLLMKHARYPYGSPQMLEASIDLVAKCGFQERLIELITSRVSACEDLIRTHSKTPQRVEKLVIDRYREALYKAVLLGLFHERIFDAHTAQMAKVAALKLRGLDGRSAVIERFSRLASLEGMPFSEDRAATYRGILDSLEAPIEAYKPLAEFYADNHRFEEALQIYEAIIRNNEVPIDRHDTRLKLALYKDIDGEHPDLVEMRCRCVQALFERAGLLERERKTYINEPLPGTPSQQRRIKRLIRPRRI